MSLVLDASLTLSWFIPDEHRPELQIVLDLVEQQGAVVPDFWRLEVGNALLLATRRRRIGSQLLQDAFDGLEALPITVDVDASLTAWTSTFELATRFNLTLSDACYLELAKRRQLPLATLDRELRRAAKAANVELLGG